MMLKEDRNLTGNARFEGFCIDLLKWIAGQVGFHYAIRLVPDHMYGVYDPNSKQWNGIVRELVDKVHIRVSSLCWGRVDATRFPPPAAADGRRRRRSELSLSPRTIR